VLQIVRSVALLTFAQLIGEMARAVGGKETAIKARAGQTLIAHSVRKDIEKIVA
jgi:hypothetical protein